MLFKTHFPPLFSLFPSCALSASHLFCAPLSLSLRERKHLRKCLYCSMSEVMWWSWGSEEGQLWTRPCYQQSMLHQCCHHCLLLLLLYLFAAPGPPSSPFAFCCCSCLCPALCCPSSGTNGQAYPREQYLGKGLLGGSLYPESWKKSY